VHSSLKPTSCMYTQMVILSCSFSILSFYYCLDRYGSGRGDFLLIFYPKHIRRRRYQYTRRLFDFNMLYSCLGFHYLSCCSSCKMEEDDAHMEAKSDTEQSVFLSMSTRQI
jgi:hypothetical protein